MLSEKTLAEIPELAKKILNIYGGRYGVFDNEEKEFILKEEAVLVTDFDGPIDFTTREQAQQWINESYGNPDARRLAGRDPNRFEPRLINPVEVEYVIRDRMHNEDEAWGFKTEEEAVAFLIQNIDVNGKESRRYKVMGRITYSIP